jgi:hypothetical protein
MDDFVTVEEIQSSKTFTICSLKRKLACPWFKAMNKSREKTEGMRWRVGQH